MGGMGKIPDALGKVLISMGCDVFLNSEVERIRVKDGNISGVEVEGHNPFDADIVISSLSAIQTYQDLIDPEDVPKKLRKQVEKTPLSASVFSVQLGLANKIDVRSHFNYIFPSMEEQYKLYTDVSYNQGMLFYSVPTITVPELAPEGGSVVEMFTPINQNLPIDVWDEKRKDQVADSTIQMLSRLHDIDVVVRRVCSPRDFQTNLHLPNGAIYGMTAGIDPWKYYSHKSPISGLYLTGQTTYPGFGISPAMMSGIITAETILEFERSQ